MADSPAQQAAANLLDELAQFAEDPVEAPAEGEQSAETQELVDDGIEIPEINFDTPEEIRDLLEEPDLDLEEPDDRSVEEFDIVNPVEIDEYSDENTKRLAAQVNRLNKQLAWEKQQKVKASKRGWAEEARKYFQFSNPEVIQADSRRSFLREAKAQHDAVAKVAKPIFDQLKVQKAQLKEQALAEARAEAEKRWGRPTQGPGSELAPRQDTSTVRRERLEHGRSLKDLLKNRLANGEVNF